VIFDDVPKPRATDELTAPLVTDVVGACAKIVQTFTVPVVTVMDCGLPNVRKLVLSREVFNCAVQVVYVPDTVPKTMEIIASWAAVVAVSVVSAEAVVNDSTGVSTMMLSPLMVVDARKYAVGLKVSRSTPATT